MNNSSKGRVLVDVSGKADDVACVRIAGEVDIAADEALDKAAAKILDTPPRGVYVDLACVEFAGTTLVHFLYRVIGGLPAGTPVVLCRPDFMTGRVINICSLHAVATVSADLPADFADASSPGGHGSAIKRAGQLTPSAPP